MMSIVNKRQWDLRLKFSKLLASPLLQGTEGNYTIPSSTIKGALRHAIANKASSPESSVLFGHLDGAGARAGHLHFSSLGLCSNDHKIETRLHLALDRLSGGVKEGPIYQDDVLENPVFRGALVLSNGGINPAINAFELIRHAIPWMNLGRGNSRGFGSVTEFWLERNVEIEKEWLGEIDHIFWTAGDSLIRKIVQVPELINRIEWRDLERIVAQIFAEIGFRVELTSSSHDGGKDVVLFCASAKQRDSRFYVEVKHWRGGNKVGSGVIRKLIDIVFRDGASGGVFLSTSGFARGMLDQDKFCEEIALGDLSTIHRLARYYMASRDGLGVSKSRLEEIAALKF